MSHARRDFTPAALLRNPHVMTVLPGRWPRRALLAGVPTESRLFTTEPHTQLLGFCHWQPHPTACQTVVLVHGLEGSSESHYMRGIASKAYRAGFNVIRMNQRTCGGTEHLTPTLYNNGLSQDYRAIVHELSRMDGSLVSGLSVIHWEGILSSKQPEKPARQRLRWPARSRFVRPSIRRNTPKLWKRLGTGSITITF
jgi:predicted alpha/beta-fold hydrolase